MTMKKRYLIGLLAALAIGLLTLGSAATIFAPDSADWRDHCPDAQPYVQPDDPDNEYSEYWVCDGGASTVVIYKDDQGFAADQREAGVPVTDTELLSAEEIKTMSLNLAIAQGFGEDVLADGPTWVKLVGTPPTSRSSIPADPCAVEPLPTECQH